MGKGTRYTDEFKQEVVNQVDVRGYSVLDVSKRVGIANKSLYDWIKKVGNKLSKTFNNTPITSLNSAAACNMECVGKKE